jgi:hypothetical protein
MKICSDSHDSTLRMKSKVALEHFTLETVWLELKNNAPLLVMLFHPFSEMDMPQNRCVCVCMFDNAACAIFHCWWYWMRQQRVTMRLSECGRTHWHELFPFKIHRFED